MIPKTTQNGTELAKVFAGTGYCYHCANEQCPKSTDTNLDVLWCANAANVITDCAELGYKKTSTGKCSDGSAGLACPFDKSYIFCQGK